MRPLDVFKTLTGSRSLLRVHHSGSADSIPESPGCYAWLLPLWIYRDDLDALSNFVGTLLDYEQEPTKAVDAPFTWESVKLQVNRRARVTTSDAVRRSWRRALADSDIRNALQRTLMEASLLMPPLYVGRTNNLKHRYRQHVENRHHDANTFNARFTACARTLTPPIAVSDLLFACIETPQELRGVLDRIGDTTLGLDGLLEQVLMQFCRPPFSLK